MNSEFPLCFLLPRSWGASLMNIPKTVTSETLVRSGVCWRLHRKRRQGLSQTPGALPSNARQSWVFLSSENAKKIAAGLVRRSVGVDERSNHASRPYACSAFVPTIWFSLCFDSSRGETVSGHVPFNRCSFTVKKFLVQREPNRDLLAPRVGRVPSR